MVNQILELAEQNKMPLTLYYSYKTIHWKATRQIKKQKPKFELFAKQFVKFITSGQGLDKIREPNTLNAIIYTGNFFFGIGNTRMAQDFYEKAIFLNRAEFIAWNNLGVLLYVTRDPIRAFTCFEKTIELNNNIAAPWFNHGYVLLDMGREDEAIERFQKALELEPTNAQMWFLFGLAFSKRKDFQAAIKPYQLALEQQPDFEDAYEHLSIAFQMIGENGKSLKSLEKLLELNSKRPETLAQMGAIYFKLGLRSKGTSSYMKAADIYEEKGLVKEAQKHRNLAKK